MIYNTCGLETGGGTPTPIYSGPYSVNSSLDTTQTLNTSGKLLEQNITINSIVITRTANQYGGITVTIEEAS